MRREALETQRIQEESLAKEMEAIRLQTVRDERIRKQIRDNSDELRGIYAYIYIIYTGYPF